jgi:beta-lactamase superfamily II metal-dependent hydrolase
LLPLLAAFVSVSVAAVSTFSYGDSAPRAAQPVAAQPAASADPTIGVPLAPWTPGTLDIHQIATGRGNATLLVLPDGTTLLVDAGAVGDGTPQTDPHPDGTRPPGAWIVRYLTRHLPEPARGLDYALITHFHPDHMGAPRPDSPSDRTGAFKLAGITEVIDAIPTRTLIDRGAPGYDYPAPLTDAMMKNYRAFVTAKQADGLKVERFRPGAADQIALRRDAARFDTFEIRNIVGNGELWTGTGSATRQLFPAVETLSAADRPTENMCSLGLRLRYGNFRYFTGGDLPGTADPGFPAWHALEPFTAPVIGPVDVHVVSQHGSMGQEIDAYIQALRSKVIVIPSWQPSHPAPDVLKRLMNSRFPPADRLIFATDMREATKVVIGARATQLAGPTGHIVIRVEPGGARYRVYTLDNRDERDLVTSAHGPFAASAGGVITGGAAASAAAGV